MAKRLAYAPPSAIIKTLNLGGIINSSVTPNDISTAYKIYGPDLGALRGRTTTATPRSIRVEHIPRVVVSELDMHVDLMFVDGNCFLVSVTEPLGVRMVQELGRHRMSRSTSRIFKALHDQISSYKARNFIIRRLHTDGEGGVIASQPQLEAMGVEVNLQGANQHVPVIERAIREIKERCRSVYNTLPYKLPSSLVVWLVYFCVSRINLIPHRSGLAYISPREAFTSRKTDFKRDLRVGFGEYLECAVPRMDNSLQPRTSSCISLFPTGNAAGSVKVLSLSTGKVVTRDHFKILPMPQFVIDHMNNMAKQQENHPEVLLNFSFGPQALEPLPGVQDGEEYYDPPLISIDENVVDEPESEEQKNDFLPEKAGEAEDDSNAQEETEQSAPADTTTSREELTTQSLDPTADTHNILPSEGTSDSAESQLTQVGEPRYNLRQSSNLRQYYLSRNASRGNSLAYDSEGTSFTFNISVKKALEKYPLEANDSIKAELRQMIEKRVWRPVLVDELDSQQRRKIIRSFMFLKEKYSPTTKQLEKLKSRLVAMGNMQNHYDYLTEDTASPTAQLPLIMLIAAIAAKEGRHVRTADITGAYLNAEMKETVHMRLDKDTAKLLCELDDKYKAFLTLDGSIVVVLNKALYGCVESAKLWYDTLTSQLIKCGYVQNPMDKCIFNKILDGVQATCVIYVDDLFMTSKSIELLDELTGALTNAFKSLTINDGRVHSYLGMSFNFTKPGEVSITMNKYTDDLLKACEPQGLAETPAADNLFKIRPDAKPLDENTKDKFHSHVAKILYLAKRVRPEILLATTFLATRVKNPGQEDWKKLKRLLKYINKYPNLGIVLKPAKEITISADIDASYGVHTDSKSHSTLTLSVGGGAFLSKSSKQKIVVKSSTEGELVALSDMCTIVIWIREFLLAQGERVPAARVYQDNQSTMAMIKSGVAQCERTRHISIRYYWVKDRVKLGDLDIVYKPTNEMLADLLTKPLQGEQFAKLRHTLLYWD